MRPNSNLGRARWRYLPLGLWPIFACAACELVDPIGSLERENDASISSDAPRDGFSPPDGSADASVDASVDVSPGADGGKDATDGAPPSCSTGGNPCSAVTTANNGCYCGKSNQLNFNPSQAVSACIYDCQNGAVTKSKYCTGGCILEEAGVMDQCSDGTNCKNLP